MSKLHAEIVLAAANLAAQNRLVAEHTGKPPQVGFAYLHNGVPLVVVSAHPDDATTKFCAPLYDRPELEHADPEQYAHDKPVVVPLPVRGFGEAVLHYNRADWYDADQLAPLPLVAVLDPHKVEATRRKWRATVLTSALCK
jgi:hypothetical protein